MATHQDIEPALRKFITDNFLFRQSAEPLADTTSFLETGLIDSTGVLELVFFLEKNWGIKVADEEMVPENLDSIRNLVAYVQRKVEAKRSAA
jgi:acyl carrier protein